MSRGESGERYVTLGLRDGGTDSAEYELGVDQLTPTALASMFNVCDTTYLLNCLIFIFV